MNKITEILCSLFVLSLCAFNEGCERTQIEDFIVTLKGDTYTKEDNSAVYYSTGDTIRVEFSSPGGRPVTLDSFAVFPVRVGVFRIKFYGLNDTEVNVKRYPNPTSGEQLEPEVSNTAVSKLTLIAKVTTVSADANMSLFVHNLTGCSWECAKKENEDFSVTLRGPTYAKGENSMMYYSKGDTIRVDFSLPEGRTVTLQYLHIVPTNVSVLKAKFIHFNDTKTIVFI
ncbi:hypothetical protein ACOMHN_056374 [Nucella lapillus]